MSRHTTSGPRSGDEGAALGLLSTAVLAVVYLAFTSLGAFAPELLAAPVRPGGAITWAFALGLGVIGLGFVLTVAYALAANRREKAAEGGAAVIAAEGVAR
ncbi:DUF485 domain-containing protein [Xanthobacter agilis]|jgi:uncharacterized membrane protein (DUF485 family)|uniref:Uncharacterized membrane protein (DUF485 family) n=1 Tax=Xanthobacter agilis TaxID=47492 RepID=A0ABU0LJZ2_XANAG|nr:DUF485 domain-containing protein [Xanthobacter agilis]MDQ0507461.1 uncharacterized membrane protein (DUF485 family) [Xanthobacter agilis]